MRTLPDPRLSRRQLLAASAGLAWLAACGGGKQAASSTTATAGPTGTTGASRFQLVQFFGPDVLQTGAGQRAPFGIGDKDGVITKDAPASLAFTISSNGKAIGSPLTVERRDTGLPRPYFPLVFDPPDAGVYDVATEIDGEPATASIQVSAPGTSGIPGVGDPMVAVATPTEADKHGVDPICTRDPACPLHTTSLDDALAAGSPVAFLISTPKFCQVAICGPVLDVLVAQQQAFPQVRMLHAEVYTDETTQTTAPAVQAYNLSFEPCLFLAKADGTIAHRLDNIFDAVELKAALTSLVA